MATDFTGVVLAGGRSSRMGRDKAALPWGHATLLDRMVELLKTAGATRVLVSGERPGHAGIPDLLPGRGPVGGLHAVLAQADGRVVVVPVDLPRLRPSRIHALVAALDGAGAATLEGHPLPCALWADDASRALVTDLVGASPYGLPVMRLLEALGAEVVVVDEPSDDLQPCNTPAQWAALRQ